jgi:hypothetical protein
MKHRSLILLLFSLAGLTTLHAQHIRDSGANIDNVTAGSVNGVFNATSCSSSARPSWCSGSDVGAWVNSAAAACVSAPQCRVVIPPSAQQTVSTPIVFVKNETLDCPSSNVIANDSGKDTGAQLYYNGTGVAITMNANSGRLVGCDLLLGSSVSVGISVAGYSNHVRDVGLRGGGTSTTLIHVGSTSIPTEDNHIERTRLSDWMGPAISVDHANDTFITNVTSYGKIGRATGTGLLIDSNGNGVIIDNFICGQCGNHGYVKRNTLGGTPPTFVFADDMEIDEARSDGWLYDSSMGSANVDDHFVNSWSAGSGGAGIKIAGGSGITNVGCHIRVNAGDGVLIDGTRRAEYSIVFNGCLVQGNNTGNTPNLSGFRITGHPGPVVISGNQITNHPEVGGHQKYALLAQSDVEGLIFNNNICSQNEAGCYNTAAVIAAKKVMIGNMNTDLGPPLNYFPGGVQLNSTFQMRVIPVASLPPCDGAAEGTLYPVNNSNTTIYNATVGGGGINHILAYCNGRHWVAH